jgi:serine/threonine protein kinase
MSLKEEYEVYQKKQSHYENQRLPEGLAEKYEISRVLSNKSNRAVYLVEQKETNLKCVIKATGSESPDSANREYDFLSALDFPGIPKAVDYFADDSTEYLVREYAEGDTLDVLVERDGVFDSTAIMVFTRKLCEIISYLHKQKPPIIFRDLKPENIVVTPGGKMTLIDFGIAKQYDKEKQFDTAIIGSVEYASPEQFGFGSTDLRSDVFTLGKLMIFLATGKSDLRGYVKDTALSPLKRIIMKCVRLSPQRRYHSVDSLTRAINTALNPPTGRQIAFGIIAACLIIITSLIVGLNILGRSAQSQESVTLPLTADGREVNELIRVPVDITVLFNGDAFPDSSVSADNRNWYGTASDGKATLLVYPGNDYVSRAAFLNRVAETDAPIKPGERLRITLDIGKTPNSDEFISFSIPCGEGKAFSLPIEYADEVELINQPSGIGVEKREGKYVLIVSADNDNSGFYTWKILARNEFGHAISNIRMFFDNNQQPIPVGTPEELDSIRYNLSASYILTKDIDLSSFGVYEPVGTELNPFTGVFDGDGHSITGLTITADNYGIAGLFGYTRNAWIRRLIIKGATVTAPNDIMSSGKGIFVGRLENSLLEHCAAIGGSISVKLGYQANIGGLCGLNRGEIDSCFNSAEIINEKGLDSEFVDTSYAGGISGSSSGVISNCGNAGLVTNSSAAGGIAAFSDMNYLTRCYNAGEINGVYWRSEYYPGGIVHLVAGGYLASYSYFGEETASVGATVSGSGRLLDIKPIDRTAFRNSAALPNLGSFEGADAVWRYASADSNYPMPAGIFREQAATPTLPENGTVISLPAIPGVLYFYTLDGQNPYTAAVEGVHSIDITLKAGETLTLFTAEHGKYDSEIVTLQ